MTMMVVGLSRGIMGLNRVVLHGAERFEQARRSERGLLTFSNHVSLFDDPLLTACFSRARFRDVRWIAADALNFFGDPLRAALFNTGRAVPIVRGVGVEQPGMRFLTQRLRAGDWVHVFPEGGRTRDPQADLRRPFKQGMAHLIHSAHPLLLPFRHRGMHDVLPIGARLPRTGRPVDVRFGAITDSRETLAAQDVEAITRWAEDTLSAL